MSLQSWRPKLSADYAATARMHAADIAAALFLFAAASIAAGRVWRFAFDDELLTRMIAERSASLLDFALFFLKGGDIHPPLAFVTFYALVQAGFADWGLRLFSLAMTGLSLALFHVLCLTTIRQRTSAAVRPLIRLIAVMLFGLCPMAVSQGDAMRWYPMFAAFAALAVVFYLAAGNRAARLCSAIVLGLAASTNFMAIFVGLALSVYRYGLERRFRWRLDAAYWGLAALFASTGLVTAFFIATRRWVVMHAEFSFGAFTAAAIDALGIFGGASVGVGNAWLILPAALITPFALVAAINRQSPADPMHLLLLLLAAIPIMALFGFAEPRAFLYLMPALAALLVLFIAGQDANRGTVRSVAIFAGLFATSVGAIANINQTSHPFKRNAVVPFREVIDFIDINGNGRVLVVSTDPVLAWLLLHEAGRAGRCASYFMQNMACFAAAARYDTIFLVTGHSYRSGRDNYRQRAGAEIARLVSGRQKTASVPFGFDADAGLKTWLTKTPLSPAILTAEIYR